MPNIRDSGGSADEFRAVQIENGRELPVSKALSITNRLSGSL